MEYSKGKALVVGVNDYTAAQPLSNAVNDASSFAAALDKLCYSVDTVLNPLVSEWDKKLNDFINSLKNYDSAVFYFAGHGVEIEGHNYLLVKDTPVDCKDSIKRQSINLQEVIQKIHDSDIATSIIIIGACRNNPFRDRTIGPSHLAPMFAPRGTLIAYSTSPGQTASDGGYGNNSIYTGSLIKHIYDEDISIEEFFKNVRETVYALSNGTQTSWEHTSLIGKYSFNSGQLIHSLNVDYSPTVIADKSFDTSSDSLIGEIIKSFKSNHYNTQNIGLINFKYLDIEELNKNQLFIVGRNILQAAVGGSWACQEFISKESEIDFYNTGKNNHILNGILYEMYFSPEGLLRERGFKGQQYLTMIMRYRTNPRFANSFRFIKNALLQYSDRLLFIPSTEPETVHLNASFIKETINKSGKDEEVLILNSLKFGATELLDDDRVQEINKSQTNSLEKLKENICKYYQIPDDMLKIITNEQSYGEFYMKKKLRQL